MHLIYAAAFEAIATGSSLAAIATLTIGALLATFAVIGIAGGES